MDNFKDIFKDNFNDSFKDNFKETIKDNFTEILKNILTLSHTGGGSNCPELFFNVYQSQTA